MSRIICQPANSGNSGENSDHSVRNLMNWYLKLRVAKELNSRLYLMILRFLMPGALLFLFFNFINFYHASAQLTQDSISPLPPFGVSVDGGQFQVSVCEAARPFNNLSNDASVAIQRCIDDAPQGNIVEIPIGKYSIDRQIKIVSKPVTLRTQGKNEMMQKCDLSGSDCAEFIASTNFSDINGILYINAQGSTVDHIVINGNNINRLYSFAGRQCQFGLGDNRYGFNISSMCSDCRIINSVSKNALCGTGLEVRSGNFTLRRNTIANNGLRGARGPVSDGVTVGDSENSIFIENEFIDNTDIDLIFGGCVNCLIQGNRIIHSEEWKGSSYAGLILHAWPSTSGNFSNSAVVDNLIDCGPQKRCGFGLLIGSDAWYASLPYGGSVHDNAIQNAQQGFSIDDAFNFEVYNNKVSLSGTQTITSCGNRQGNSYSKGSRSYNIDSSKDNPAPVYSAIDWDGCIPNNSRTPWWQSISYFVTDLYQCILERAPDQGGLASWEHDLTSRAVSIVDIYREFFESNEYQGKNVSNSSYITHMYNCVLFRSTSDPGFDSWLSVLNSGTQNKASILDSFLNSNEFQTFILPGLQNLIP